MKENVIYREIVVDEKSEPLHNLVPVLLMNKTIRSEK